MKTYQNIEDLYRDKFSDYAPQPPAEVWERIQSATRQKQQPAKGKAAIWATAAVVAVATATYFLIDTASLEKNKAATQQTQQQMAADTPLAVEAMAQQEVVLPSNEQAVVSERKTPRETISPCVQVAEVGVEQNVEPNHPAVALPPMQPKPEKEVAEEPAKVAAVPAKEPAVEISKDTTVCENSIVKLFVLHAKNLRWSTGEVKNTIYVNPTSDEQYSATFTTGNHLDTTVYINIKTIQCSELFVPNAFTPNGDGLNDLFAARSEEQYAYFEMAVYSREGHLLFQSKDIKQGWNGTYKGVLQPHGSYMYMIRYKDADGKMNERKGNFLLILQ